GSGEELLAPTVDRLVLAGSLPLRGDLLTELVRGPKPVVLDHDGRTEVRDLSVLGAPPVPQQPAPARSLTGERLERQGLRVVDAVGMVVEHEPPVDPRHPVGEARGAEDGYER